MADFAVGDLYDLTAARLKGVAIDETVLYHCRFCTDFKIVGKHLLSTNSARSHAAAHRIAFDALLDPKPVLTCLICDESVGEEGKEGNAIVNDLDLVHHLVANHNDLLSDELVGDFAEPSYLLTTYVDSSRLLQSSSDFLDGPSDDEECSSGMPDIQPHCSASEGVPDGSQGAEGAPELTLPEAHKNSHSRISCLQCNWDSRQISSRSKLKRKLISHIRSHIRLKLAEPCNEADSIATERLCCIEYVLEEYAETGELDLSNAHCSGLPTTYHNLLVETFGLSLPLVMRIVHGVGGNPFKGLPDEDPTVIEIDADSRSTEDSPDAESVAQDDRLYEVPAGCSVPENLLVACGREECGNMVVDIGDMGAFIRHLAAHIRHDEKRLQRTATPLVCECGLASYSPQGFIYHEFRDHCFTKKAYSGFAKATVSYIVMVWDALIRSCAGSDEIILTLLEGPWQRTNIRSLVPLWGAFLCLENDEGEEITFANCSTPCESWLRKWKNLADKEWGFGDLDNLCSTLGVRRSTYHSGVSDLIRILETHPFVSRLQLPRAKKHVYTPFDEKSQQRMFNVAWKQLNSWLARPESARNSMASTTRWNQLYDIRRRVNYKKNKALIKTDGVRNIHWTDKDLAPFQCIPGLVPRQSDYVAPQFYISGREQIEINGRPEREEQSNGSAHDESQADNFVKKEDETETKEIEVEEVESCPDTAQENNHAMNFIVLSPDPSLKGQYRSCLICENYYMPAENIEKITIHCAAHAILEARQLSNLYIHLQSERPLSCPFCLKEHLPYSPLAFMDHIEHEHHAAALFLYEKILKTELPVSAFVSEPVPQRPKDATAKPMVFVIKCQRKDICGLESGVLRLARGGHQNGYDIDKDVLNHILWHVKNDDGIKVGKSETELMSKVLSTRLIISNTNLSHRLIPIMTRKAIRHWPRLSRKEPEVLRFVLSTLHEHCWTLFGVNKGLVFSMVFPRRWHRDQCGIFLYPVCQCLLCAELQLSKYSMDRRKRIFLSNVRPVLCHVIDHLDCGDIPEVPNSCSVTCPLDGNSFSRVTDALNHLLNSHKNVMELSVLRNLLLDMGILGTFSALLKVIFGSQTWQLEEALGFDAFVQRKVSRPTFFEEMEHDYHYLLRDHRADCVRFRDAFAKHCQCGDVISSTTSAVLTKNGSSNGLPSEALPFYKEFLETEAEAGNSSDSADALSVDVPEAGEATVKTEPIDEEPFPAADLASPNPLSGNIAELLGTLMCANLLATSLGTQPMFPFDPTALLGTVDPTALLGAIDPSTVLGSGAVQAEELLGIAPKKKQREKRKSVCAEEKNTPSITVDRNSQLPLKNVIQGTKTVAAAVAAALGTVDETVDQPMAPAPVVKPNISAPNVTTSDMPSLTLLGKRERHSIYEEESDLALGSMTKRVRQSSTSDAPKKKQRSRRRRQTMISSLLFSDDC